jgi:hypothetical protein
MGSSPHGSNANNLVQKLIAGPHGEFWPQGLHPGWPRVGSPISFGRGKRHFIKAASLRFESGGALILLTFA